MIEKKLVILNKWGLHARPAAMFVKTADKFDAEVYISKDGVEVNGKSIMGVLMLAAERGSEVVLRITGKDEKQLCAALVDLLEGKFDEE